ncbi:PRC-barrel domain-containing protein [Telmatospirillum siberiense]|uniref:PRC-barrel domain-containing protein n=1 Tax=Telmatospirillum siberiense TaxID=382514 RepID=UPI0018EDD5BF|nr:PRC-barrel domain-containing protein [Telmatospirillum siberiense]
MLRNASVINGYAIQAIDGRIGTISDFLFDDATWLIRWLVVDTGSWLSGRRVLLPPSVLGHIDLKKEEFSVRLTMQEVTDSPNIDTEQPVSRQMESQVYNHYGWSPYWGTDFYIGGYGDMSGVLTASPSLDVERQEADVADALRAGGDPHLRSIAAVTGYHIQASDGEIGHIEDFLVQEADWSIHYLVVDTRNWWLGKKVLISPRSARGIDWASEIVTLNVDRQRVKDSPAYESAMSVDRTFERNFHNYYTDGRHGDRT